MKKLVSIMLCAVMAMSLAACGTTKDEKKTDAEITENTVSIKSDGENNNLANVTGDFDDERDIEGETGMENISDEMESSYSSDGKLSIKMYDSKNADVHYLCDREVKAGLSLYLDGTDYTVLYGDVGTGIGVRIANNANGDILNELEYEFVNNELIIHLDLSGLQNVSLDTVSSFSVDVNYDGEKREYTTYRSGDVVTKADSNNTDSGAAGSDTNTGSETDTGSGAEKETDVSSDVLSNYVGKYTDGAGNSFEIKKDLGYGVKGLKLYSVAGWPEELDNDGIRFYDTPTIDSVKQGNGYVLVKTISQYTLAEGTFKFSSNGTVEVTYSGGILSGSYSGTFSK